MNEKTTPAVKPPFRIHYLVLGCMALLFLGLIYAWSIFRTPLQAIFPEWTASNLSLGYTILMLCFFIGSFTIQAGSSPSARLLRYFFFHSTSSGR